MNSISRQWKKLRDKKYREEFVAAQARRAIPYQIRTIMKARGLSQQELAERSGLTQGVISRASNPAYGKMTLNTIIRVAAGFDVAFIGVFVPFSKLTGFFDRLSDESLSNVATFVEEDAVVIAAEVKARRANDFGNERQEANGSCTHRYCTKDYRAGGTGTRAGVARRASSASTACTVTSSPTCRASC